MDDARVKPDMDLKPLVALGHTLAGLRWVQGPGGNLSLKEAGMLAVKASGARLGHLDEPEALAFVPLQLAEQALAGDVDAETTLFALHPRPSMETWLHALPGQFVAHTHPLGVLLVACSRAPGPGGMADVPAALPGRELALQMRAMGEMDVWLLRNHGLCVMAPTAEVALERTLAADKLCREQMCVNAEEVPQLYEMHVQTLDNGVACPLPNRTEPHPRYLFPDVAVLATETPVVALDVETAREKLQRDPRPGVLATHDRQRWAVARNLKQLRDVVEVVTASDWLLRHLGERALPLPPHMVEAIVQMPAEKFRQLGKLP